MAVRAGAAGGVGTVVAGATGDCLQSRLQVAPAATRLRNFAAGDQAELGRFHLALQIRGFHNDPEDQVRIDVGLGQGSRRSRRLPGPRGVRPRLRAGPAQSRSCRPAGILSGLYTWPPGWPRCPRWAGCRLQPDLREVGAPRHPMAPMRGSTGAVELLDGLLTAFGGTV